MVSDWLKTQKKRPRTNQIRADLTTNLRKNGHGSQQTTIFCKQNNNRKVKKIFQKPKHNKKHVLLAKSIENSVLREKYSKKIEENESEKLNKLLITDYAEVKNKEQKPWQPHASHDSYTFQAFKRTRIQVFHDNNRDFKSRTLFVGGERCLFSCEDLY